MICHDLPDARPDPRQVHPDLERPITSRATRQHEEVNLMSAQTEVRSWLPQLFNWLAVVVLLSLGVLV
jgi:hypothetical protein